MEKYLKIKKPDDFHLHLRDGNILKSVLSESKNNFARALIMPNLSPPIILLKQAKAYRNRILSYVKAKEDFTPLMTLYLTENSSIEDIVRAHQEGICTAIKLYPNGVTTNSNQGVTSIKNVMKILEKMADIKLPLCVHGETPITTVDIFDREKVFIETILRPLHKELPTLKITLEHISTKEGVEFVESSNKNVAGSITPHHLMMNRNQLFSKGIRPHFFCLPILKREKHRLALINAATSGNPKFFLGTDSAPHLDGDKESSCGCAGIFNASNAIECLTQIFYEGNQLQNLEKFTSENGAAHYNLDQNQGSITLIRKEQANDYKNKLKTSEGDITIFNPNSPIFWKVERERQSDET